MGDFQQVTNIFDMTTDYKVTELFCIIEAQPTNPVGRVYGR